jgi:hypothetical protein
VCAIKRREFITLLGGAAAAWSFTARAQQPTIPVIGFLSSLSAPVTTKRISSFGEGLSELGYTVGRDATVEVRMAKGRDDQLPALAADLVSRRVQLIAASGPPAAFAAKAATASIPIVFVAAFDPVQAGLVASLNRPGGNVTGITLVGAGLGGKRLELARELVPNVGVIALMINPNSPEAIGICSTAAIPVKTKTNTNRLGTDALCSPRLGNASRTSTTPSRPPFPRSSRRSSGNSKSRNRKGTYRFTKGALQRRSSSSGAHVR